MNKETKAENKRAGFRIQTLAFWLAVVAVILLLVTIVTMIQVSTQLSSLLENANKYNTTDSTSWNLGDMKRFLESQQRGLLELQELLSHQQIYVICLILLLVIAFVIVALTIIKPIHMFEHSLVKEEELPVIGSAEMKRLAENYNTAKRNNAASKLLFQYEAEHDALTGLFNRGAFEKMKQYLRGSLEPLAVLLIDVDLFKHVNDNYGHEVGDGALKKVSSMLTEKFRSSDLVFRVGGDEFCIIMQKVTPNEKDIIRNKIDTINAELEKQDEAMPAKLSVSVGIAFSQFGFNEDLYSKADSALYYTKKHGRKGYTFYNSRIESGEE